MNNFTPKGKNDSKNITGNTVCMSGFMPLLLLQVGTPESVDKNSLRNAIEKMNLDTIIVHIQFNEKHYCETPLVGGQWAKGKKWPWELELIHSGMHPEIRPTTKMIFPLPKS